MNQPKKATWKTLVDDSVLKQRPMKFFIRGLDNKMASYREFQHLLEILGHETQDMRNRFAVLVVKEILGFEIGDWVLYEEDVVEITEIQLMGTTFETRIDSCDPWEKQEIMIKYKLFKKDPYPNIRFFFISPYKLKVPGLEGKIEKPDIEIDNSSKP